MWTKPASAMRFAQRIFSKLRTESRPWRWAWSRFFHRTGLGTLVPIDRGLYRIWLFPTATSLGVFDDPTRYREDENFLRSCVRPGDTVIDVGANIGLVTLAAAALVGPAGRVFSFEANPHTFTYLRKNAQRNGFENIRLLGAAVGEHSGTVTISNEFQDDYNRVVDRGIRIPMVTLDEATRDHGGRIAFLKVDVEGFELFVLRGALETLRRTDCIYFETCQEHFERYGYTVPQLLRFIIEQGFTIFQLGAGGQEQPVDPDSPPGGCLNLIARRNGKTE
jgi:FkbM family methyltransferase